MLLRPDQLTDAINAAQRAVMEYPYFTEGEALEIAKAAVAAALSHSLSDAQMAQAADDAKKAADHVAADARVDPKLKQIPMGRTLPPSQLQTSETNR